MAFDIITFKKEFGLIIVGAIIFTASFLWKDLLSEIEEKFFPKGYGLMGRIFFVILVTLILVVLAIELKQYFGLSQPITFDDAPDRDRTQNEDIMDHDIGGYDG